MNYYRITPAECLRPFICNYAYVNGDGIANYHRMLGNNKDDEMKLIDVAWENGYYDLSHMNSDFLQLSGSSPKKVLERMTLLRDLSDTLL